jgi:hypothetical protein
MHLDVDWVGCTLLTDSACPKKTIALKDEINCLRFFGRHRIDLGNTERIIHSSNALYLSILFCVWRSTLMKYAFK